METEKKEDEERMKKRMEMEEKLKSQSIQRLKVDFEIESEFNEIKLKFINF